MKLSPKPLSIAAFWLATLLISAPFSPPAAAQDPLTSVSSGGLQSVDDALARLTEHRRLLMIAAHPDDEDTFLLTLVSRGQHGEAAYLSLSRGDGGQNLIGDELGPGLGLLRSRELEAARRIDGARQFFSRAYDFGYTRSLEETLRRWPRDVLLEDSMRVVRTFRPQVLVSVFPPTAAAGHGQHQASGWAAERIFELSRQEEDAFPELTAEGLEPWRIESLYRAAWFRPDTASMRLPIGQLDPVSGRSIFQTALLSRSQHRCQDMGFEQPPGDASDAVLWLAGAGDPAQHPGAEDIFAGLRTDLPALAAPLQDEELRARAEEELRALETLAGEARTGLSPLRLAEATSPLAEIVRRLAELRVVVAEDGIRPGDGRQHVLALLEEKLAIARSGLAAAAGLVVDAVTGRELVTPGEDFEVRSLFWNSGDAEIRGLSVELESTTGWVSSENPAEPEGRRRRFSATVSDERRWQVTVPEVAAPDVPYFLRRPRDGDLYDWRGEGTATRTLPFGPAALTAVFRFELDGAPMEMRREVVHRRRDQALGEVRRPLRMVPALELEVDRDLLVWPVDRTTPLSFGATVISHLDRAVTAAVRLEAPPGWPEPPVSSVELDAAGRAEVRFELRPPAELLPGSGRIALTASLEGRSYGQRLVEVDYEHIRPTVLPKPAAAHLTVVDLEIPDLDRVAYVRGASDRVPEMLLAVGVPVEVLGAEELQVRELGSFDAVVLGSRAYEVDAALGAANSRLLDYVRSGGLVIVQYQQYAYSRGAFAPLTLEIHRPHDRITDETAAVRPLLPEHPVLSYPNLMSDADWQGWVQERGLYFAGTWDSAWAPLLAMADPDGEEKHGGLLIARHGDGHYVYTGLAFFRQLPAGVGGAYRLFSNLLALAED